LSKDDEVLREAQEAFDLAAEHEDENRKTALEDIRFALLDEQWPTDLVAMRKKLGLPCHVYNKLGTYIAQVVNDARQNKPAIKCHPADSKADVATAQIYNGLIRHIEVSSKAPVAYDTALEHATAGGFGYFRIGTKYACDDTFDLDLILDRIANPFSVYGDPYSTAADSADWNSAFVVDRITKAEFAKRYKGAEAVDWLGDGYTGLKDPWLDGEQVMIAEWWRREKVKKKILLLSDQQVMAEDVYERNKPQLDALGVEVVSRREIKSQNVTQILLTGAEVLEENDWAGQYIPLVPVYGHEINVEGKRYFRALVHRAIDAQRSYNFARTKATETIALAPITPFLGPKGAFLTDQAKWETANVDAHAYIEYDGNVPPQRQPFPGVPSGWFQEALTSADDIKATIGLFDASLGAQSNETSGKAIMARQREGDTSTFHFIDNLSRAIEHAGRILIDLIPKVYTGERIVRVLGQDNAATTVPLGTPQPVMGPDGQQQMDPNTGAPLTRIYDLGVGKYDLTVETGPSFTTRREESVLGMTELLRAMPAAAPVIGPRLAKNSDWPEADEIGEELKQLAAAATGGDPGAAQAAQVDTQIKQQELQVKAYEAETKRMEVVWKLKEQQIRAVTGGIPTSQGAMQ